MSKPDPKALSARRAINLAGLWRRPKPAIGTTPYDVVFAENKWRLLRYRPRAEGLAYQTPVLLVPSLINRHYVLDLMKGKSLTAYFVSRGHDVYTIDWGTPGPEDRFLTFDDVCDRYLGRAIRKTAGTSKRNQAHVLGYCLGGTFATIHASARPEHIASLALLAAPVKFRDTGATEGLLAAWAQNQGFDVGSIVAAFGNVPWQLMQASFHLLRPTLPLAKAVTVIDRAGDDDFLDGFLALETWGNDNVSFPGACYQRYIEELYKKDALVEGTFTLSGDPARLENIKCPLLAVTFEHDNIVPKSSAAALLDHVASTDKEQLHLSGGHVGAVVARGAVKGLWPKLSEFFATRDAARPAAVAPRAATRRA
jgi:polyhydroxyalkanoate synthase